MICFLLEEPARLLMRFVGDESPGYTDEVAVTNDKANYNTETLLQSSDNTYRLVTINAGQAMYEETLSIGNGIIWQLFVDLRTRHRAKNIEGRNLRVPMRCQGLGTRMDIDSAGIVVSISW